MDEKQNTNPKLDLFSFSRNRFFYDQSRNRLLKFSSEYENRLFLQNVMFSRVRSFGRDTASGYSVLLPYDP
jgi:hypothetical protein